MDKQDEQDLIKNCHPGMSLAGIHLGSGIYGFPLADGGNDGYFVLSCASMNPGDDRISD